MWLRMIGLVRCMGDDPGLGKFFTGLDIDDDDVGVLLVLSGDGLLCFIDTLFPVGLLALF